MPELKVYTNNSFNGHWPVGVAAVVIAESKEEAAKLLHNKLCAIGIPQIIHAECMIEIVIEKQAVVLCDGNY